MLKKITAAVTCACVLLCGTIPTVSFAENTAGYPTTVLNDDFSDYTLNSDFLNQPEDLNGKVDWGQLASTRVSSAKWQINSSNSNVGMLGSSAVVIEDADNPSNTILKFHSNYKGTTGWPVLPRLTRKVVEQSGTSAYTLPTEGRLKVSAKIKVAEGTTSANMGTGLVFAIAGTAAVKPGTNYIGAGDTKAPSYYYHSLKLDENGNLVPANFSCSALKLAPNQWHTVEFVYDLALTENGKTNPCVIYADGEYLAQGVALDTTSVAGPLSSIVGLQYGCSDGPSYGGIMYYDDFKIEIIEPLAPFEPSVNIGAENVDVNSSIELYIDETVHTVDKIDELLDMVSVEAKLYDKDGAQVESTVALSNGKVVLTPEKELKYDSTYTIKVPSITGYENQEHQTFAGLNFVFETQKGRSAYINDENTTVSYGESLVSATQVDADINIINPLLETQDYICAVAAYDVNEQLVGYKTAEVNFSGEAEKTVSVSDVAVSGAAFLRLYLWQMADSGIGELMHAPMLVNPDGVAITAANCEADTLKIRTVDSINKIFNISGKSAKTGKNNFVTVILTQKSDTAMANPIAVAGVNMAEDGSFAAKFKAELTMGDYTVWAIEADKAYSVPFNYVSPDDVSDLIDDIKDGKVLTANIYNKTCEYNSSIGVKTELFDTQKKQDIFNYRFDKNRDKLTGTTNEEKLAAFTNIVELVYDELEFTDRIENAIWQNVYAIISEYADRFEINTALYSALSDAQKNAVQLAFVDKTFDNADKIKDFFEKESAEPDESETIKKPAVSGGNGGSSGGGGGGGASGTSNTTNNTNNTNTSGDANVISPAPAVTDTADIAKSVFADLEGYDWASDAIGELYRRKIVQGSGDGAYNPGANVTREEFVKLLVLAKGCYNTDANCDFEDVDKSAWYYSYLASAKAAGLVNGISETEFGIGRNISRQDMAVMIFNSLGIDAVEDETVPEFVDADSIADYATDAVCHLYLNGYVNGVGDNMFAPDATATRAEAAVIIFRLLSM